MGKLYETMLRVDAVIARKQLDPFRTRGKIAMQTGFSLGVINASTPDDDVKLARLQQAARNVLGEDVDEPARPAGLSP